MALTERLRIVLETVGASTAVKDFEKVAGASRGLASVGKDMSGVLAGAIPAAAGTAAAALVSFAAKGVDGFVTLAGEVRQFQGLVGGTAEEASRLIDVADTFNVSAEDLGKGLFQLEKRIGSGTDSLRDYGVQVVRDAHGNLDVTRTLLAVADAYRSMHDPARRAALLNTAFGKSGAALVPILTRPRAELERLYASVTDAEIISPEEQKRAEDYRIAVHDLNEAWQNLGVEVGGQVVPVLADIAEHVLSVINLVDDAKKQADDLLNKHPDLNPTDPLAGLQKHLPERGLLGQFLPDDWYQQLVNFKIITADSTKNVKGLGQQWTEFGQGLADQIDAINGTTESFDELDRAVQSSAQSDRSLAAAQRGLADVQGDLNELLREGAVDEEKVADARRSLGDATRSLGHAQRELTDRQDEYNEALAAFQVLGTDTAADKLAEASDNLADAHDAVASAQDRQKDAQGDLAKAQAGDPAFNEKLAKAKQAVADATFEVSEKTTASLKAHDDATAAIKAHADQAQRLLGYYDGLIARAPVAAAALTPLIKQLYLPGQTPLPPGVAGPVIPGGPTIPGLAPPPSTTPTAQTINVYVSSPQNADPTSLAHNIAWVLK